MSKTIKDTNIKVKDILALIPNDKLGKIAKDTNVNYYTKILDGRSLLYLILYSLIEQKRNSLRTMEDIFNSYQFKFLFNLDTSKTIKYNSISERLSIIDINFFEQSYQLFYDIFSKLYTSKEQEKHKLIRVDSSMVAEAANKIEEGMKVGKKGKQKSRPKQIKYTIAFDGTLPCIPDLYTKQEALSEDKTIAPVVFKNSLKQQNAIFIFDKGVQKRSSFTKMENTKISFVTKLKLDSRYKVIEEFEYCKNESENYIKIISDQKVNIGKPNSSKYLEEKFRIIVTYNERTDKKDLILTNIFNKTPQEIIIIYKKRWDIEVFFRFLKQELNFNHFTSTSINGIKVMMYVTLIAAMLVMIYKKWNKLGYKTAVRRIALELNDLITAMIVVHCGGDPSLVFR
jgi:hypothetical protein